MKPTRKTNSGFLQTLYLGAFRKAPVGGEVWLTAAAMETDPQIAAKYHATAAYIFQRATTTGQFANYNTKAKCGPRFGSENIDTYDDFAFARFAALLAKVSIDSAIKTKARDAAVAQMEFNDGPLEIPGTNYYYSRFSVPDNDQDECGTQPDNPGLSTHTMGMAILSDLAMWDLTGEITWLDQAKSTADALANDPQFMLSDGPLRDPCEGEPGRTDNVRPCDGLGLSYKSILLRSLRELDAALQQSGVASSVYHNYFERQVGFINPWGNDQHDGVITVYWDSQHWDQNWWRDNIWVMTRGMSHDSGFSAYLGAIMTADQ